MGREFSSLQTQQGGIHSSRYLWENREDDHFTKSVLLL